MRYFLGNLRIMQEVFELGGECLLKVQVCLVIFSIKGIIGGYLGFLFIDILYFMFLWEQQVVYKVIVVKVLVWYNCVDFNNRCIKI